MERRKDLYLYLNNYCNLNCKFCASDYTNITQKEYLDDNYFSNFCQQDSSDFFRLVISGGEPTLVPNLIEITQIASKYFKEIVIQTNGIRLADYSFLKRLIDAGISTFSIPFFSTDEATYSSLTAQKNQFDKYFKGLSNVCRAMKTRDIKLIFKVLALSNNENHVIRIPQFLKDNSIVPSHLFFHGVHFSKKLKNDNSLLPDYDRTGKIFSEAIENLDSKYKDISVVEFPLCLLTDSAIVKLVESGLKYQAKNIITTVLFYDNRSFTHNKNITQFERCNDCLLFDFCDGINSKNNLDRYSNLQKKIIPFRA